MHSKINIKIVQCAAECEMHSFGPSCCVYMIFISVE